jgi:hypothetical protein
MNEIMKKNNIGPLIYQNWQSSLDNKGEADHSFESPLFTDAHITSKNIKEIFGPYELINTIPFRNALHLFQPAVVLRINEYMVYNAVNEDKTYEDNYHGGSLTEEVAALISLALGIRIKAGAITREFHRYGDPKGLPIAYGYGENPIAPPVNHSPVLPRAIGTHLLNDADIILKLPHLTPKSASVLIKSARLFQNGLWISESDPLLSWIMLVSAIEVVAVYYWKSKYVSPIHRLEFSKPKLSELVLRIGNRKLEEEIAKELADITGARRKFLGFVLDFLPSPPINRPEEWAQLNWETASIKKSLDKIYDYRSRVLHGGIPFPAPLGHPPMYKSSTTKAWEEIPTGSSIQIGGHKWLKKDLPMNLHTFEYIVRNTILKWWQKTAEEENVNY